MAKMMLVLRYVLCLVALAAIILLPALIPHQHDVAVASGDAVRLMRLSNHNS
jgi:hypothetical protein